MPAPLADRNLLFGILALQNDFIARAQLLDAMAAWALAKSRPLGDLLVERGALRPDHRALLESLLEAHAARHGGEAASLAALSSASSVVGALRALGDPDIQASLPVPTTAEVVPTTGPARERSGARRFRILRPHARGGLGEVFVAHDEELNRQVALKEIQDAHADQAESQGRFVLEAEITGGLEHPGIVPVYGLGRYEDGRPYYAMRFIQGDSLRDAIARYHDPAARLSATERSLALRGLVGRFVDVCNAVAYAHSRGVLHRDLKPDNVMLGKYGETLVVDWGLAKATGRAEEAGEAALVPSGSGDSARTQAGKVMGTPAYMSPEQAEGRLDRMGPRSDVYSLGATLYCLLTGRAPYPRGELPDVLARVRRGDFVRPRTARPDAPPALEAVCLRAMALKPEGRYADAEEVAAEAERWLADEPVSAYREPWPARASRWMRKHPAKLAVSLAVLLLAVPLAAALVWVSDGARRRADADRQRIEGEQKATEEARGRAVALARRRKAVSAFYEKHVLAGPRPFGLGSTFDISLKEALDRARQRLRAAFADEPEDELSVSEALGQTYASLGEHGRAEELFRRAEELAKAVHGERSEERLDALGSLALALARQDKNVEADAAYAEGRRLATEALGATHRVTLAYRHNQVWQMLAAGRRAEAVAEAREVRRLRQEKLGSHDVDTLATTHLLARVLVDAGKPDEGEALYRLVLPFVRRLDGPEHPHALTCEHNLAHALSQQGKHAPAALLLSAVIDSRRKVCGPEHLDTLASMVLRADCLNDLGRAKEAEPVLRAALPLFVRKAGAGHPHTLAVRHALAMSLAMLGRNPEAEREAREVVVLRLKDLGPRHLDTLASQNLLVMIAVNRNDPKLFDEAETLCARIIPIAEEVGGPHHPATANLVANQAAVLLSRNKHVPLLPVLWKAVSRRYIMEQMPSIFSAMRLAQFASMPNNPRRDWETRLLAAWAEMQRGKLPAAETEFRAFREAKAFADADWQRHAGASLLGECLARQGNRAEAGPLLEEGHKGLLAAKAPPERVAEARARLDRFRAERPK